MISNLIHRFVMTVSLRCSVKCFGGIFEVNLESTEHSYIFIKTNGDVFIHATHVETVTFLLQ